MSEIKGMGMANDNSVYVGRACVCVCVRLTGGWECALQLWGPGEAEMDDQNVARNTLCGLQFVGAGTL
jgi:hypothetical protein